MNFHEYQAKELFAQYGIPVPAGRVARTPAEAVEAAREIGGTQWVVKAQVHAGGRGKAGGVKLADDLDTVRSEAERMLALKISTYQTGGRALPVPCVLVAEAIDIASELYLSALVDRVNRCVTFMGSAAGGVDIEHVAATEPEKIVTVKVNQTAGLQPFQARQMGFGMGLNGMQVRQLGKIMQSLYSLFTGKDLSLVEVNPLIIDGDGDLVALDAKINADDNALFRHPDLAAMRDESQEDPAELEASRHDLNYVTLARRRRAGQLPGRRRQHRRGEGGGGLQADPQQRPGGGHPGQYFWGHRALRSDCRGHHQCGRRGRRGGAGDRAAGRHQRRPGAPDAG
jgi:succinyl-CoA synthetase beta subunit